jgi:ABC-type anion transport system duplicated permease subunit
MKLVDSSGRGLSEIEYYKRQLLQHRHTIGRITQQAAEAGHLVSDLSSTFFMSFVISFNNKFLARSTAIQDPRIP